MSTCKDCLHYEVCQYHITEETDMTVNECSHGFKNKADYIEIKHGYWKQIEEPLGVHDVECIKCSVCGESWIIDEDLSFEEHTEYCHYCINCGAKMDGKEEK